MAHDQEIVSVTSQVFSTNANISVILMISERPMMIVSLVGLEPGAAMCMVQVTHSLRNPARRIVAIRSGAFYQMSRGSSTIWPYVHVESGKITTRIRWKVHQ